MYQCDICKKEFLKIRALQAHLYSHDPEWRKKMENFNKNYWTPDKRKLNQYYASLSYRQAIMGKGINEQ